MTARTYITLAPDLQRRAQARADELGVSLKSYVGGLVADDVGKATQGFQEEGAPGLEGAEPKADISIFFDLIDEGPATNIARDKDKLVGEAVWLEYQRETGRKPPRRRK